jgi:hypothetical protein
MGVLVLGVGGPGHGPSYSLKVHRRGGDRCLFPGSPCSVARWWRGQIGGHWLEAAYLELEQEDWLPNCAFQPDNSTWL